MKRLLYLIFLIFLSINVSAQDEYTKFSFVDMNVEVFADLELIYGGNRPDIDYLEAELFFYPRMAEGQRILRENVEVLPSAVVNEDKGVMRIEWDEFMDKHSYKVNRDVRVFNDIMEIGKVEYPINGLTNDFDKYLEYKGFIDVNEDIRKKANELVKGSDDVYEAVFRIAEWVRDNVKYDLSTLTAEVVQPSSWVMQHRIGVCDEVTNLFVSMLRAVNIPVRFVSGAVYSNLDNKWGTHAWAEVYFSGYGWVPYDLVFGQFGWIDPSHVKLQEGVGSGEASVSYTWRSRNVNVESPQGLNIKIKDTGRGKEVEPNVKLEVHVLKNGVKAGSYVPIQVDVENLRDFSIAPLIFISRAPEIIGKGDRILLLKGREKRSLFWIVKLDEEVEEGFLYKVGVEVKELSGGEGYNEIEYAADFPEYRLEGARRRLNILEERKEVESEIGFDCSTDKFSYYEDEVATIICSVENKGEDVKEVEVCVDKCRDVLLESGEKRAVDFFISLRNRDESELVARVEGEGVLSYDFLGLEILKIPNVEIVDFEYPAIIKVRDEGDFRFRLRSEELVDNVKISINGLGSLDIGELDGEIEVEFPYKGWKLGESLNVKIEFEDVKGSRFEKVKEFSIEIEEVGFFSSFFYNFLDALS